MTIYQPYVYIIRWTNANKGYIGVRYTKGCNPNDLFTSYFTSSKSVHQLISEVGLPDKIKIFPYSDKETALLMEEKFQRRFQVLESEYWVNLHISGKFYNKGHSKETKEKMSKSHRGKIIPLSQREKISKSRTGFEDSIQTRNKKSLAHRGRKHTIKTLEKMSKSKSGANHPNYDNTIYNFYNCKNRIEFEGTKFDFYTKYKLNRSSVNSLIKGKRKSHKGWVIQ